QARLLRAVLAARRADRYRPVRLVRVGDADAGLRPGAHRDRRRGGRRRLAAGRSRQHHGRPAGGDRAWDVLYRPGAVGRLDDLVSVLRRLPAAVRRDHQPAHRRVGRAAWRDPQVMTMAAPGETLFTLRDVTMNFGNLVAIQGVLFEVHR